MNDSQQPLNALPQGHRLQEYELVRVLGFGGFGMTYLGFDHNLDKAVAIKEYLPSDIATRTGDNSVVPQASQFQDDFKWGLDRFLDEARALARFDHRHIIKVHRFFEAHGTAYIVMEYAEGETLSAFLERKGTLKEAELKAILYPILDGLEVVHGADFLHRDIKPGNIIIRDEDNSPVLLDFGSARRAIGARNRSVTSIITPGYAPIEQYSSRGDQGPWTDIYALGGVCYRALTGEVPDDATDRMRRDPLIPVVERCAGPVSAEFLSAIDWALAVDEGDRPQSIAAWRANLEGDSADVSTGILEREIVDGTTVRQHDDISVVRKKTKGKLLAAAIGVVALIVVGVAGKIYVDQVERERQEQARLAVKQAEKQRQEQARLAAEQAKKRRQEQAALLEKQRQVFVAKVGRMPYLGGVNNEGATDLHIATQQNLPAVIISLLNQGADVDAKAKDDYTPLHLAAFYNARETADVLLKHGADVDAKAKDGYTPLHAAALNNAPEAAEVLLRYGTDANVEDKIGYTPLHVAVLNNAREVAEVLLDHGADVNAKNKDEFTPLSAAAMNNASETAEMLLNHGADVNAKGNNGSTPLHAAAFKNAREVAEVLLDHGADVNAKANNGVTPLYTAAMNNASETAEMLLNHGADANAKDKGGFTPLHAAVGKNARGTAEVLLKYGADVNVKNKKGVTPLRYAVAKNAREAAEVLLRYGGRR